MDTTKFNVAMPWKRTRKGKTIMTKEEKQFCRLMLHVLQDPITINEQKNQVVKRKLLDITTTCLFDVENTQLKAWKPNGD